MKWFRILINMSHQILINMSHKWERNLVNKYGKKSNCQSSKDSVSKQSTVGKNIVKAGIAIIIILVAMSVLASVANRSNPDAIIDNARCYEVVKKYQSSDRGKLLSKGNAFKIIKNADLTNADVDLFITGKTNPKIKKMMGKLENEIIQDGINQFQQFMNAPLF